eukprot:CFRG3655T1
MYFEVIHNVNNVRGIASAVWADRTRNSITEVVGKTPLIRLKNLSDQCGRNILAKAEFLNAGGSIKDRAALYLIKDAEDKELLKPGGTVVEGTAGNTGIGLAHICAAKGYKCVIFMPDTQSQEKMDLLRTLGADVRPVPAVAFSNPENFNHQAARFAEATPNAVWTNQFDNVANRLAHYEMTGPEIWEQTDGRIDAFTCGTGTGGTLAGTGKYLLERNPNLKLVLADPPGSVLFNYINKGQLERMGDGSITEGIGQGRVTDNLKGVPINSALHITDEKSVAMVFRLLREEGIFVGASSGLNVQAALEVAMTLPVGSNVATILCDVGQRYYQRLFSKSWLETKGLYDCINPAHRNSLRD